MDLYQLMLNNPRISIILIAFIISFISLLITKFITDQKKMKALRDRQKELSKLSRQFKNDLKKLNEINSEMLKISAEMMRHSFKPMLITLIPILLLFKWIGDTFRDSLPNWIWYYIFAGIISTIILRRILNVV